MDESGLTRSLVSDVDIRDVKRPNALRDAEEKQEPEANAERTFAFQQLLRAAAAMARTRLQRRAYSQLLQHFAEEVLKVEYETPEAEELAEVDELLSAYKTLRKTGADGRWTRPESPEVTAERTTAFGEVLRATAEVALRRLEN